MEAYKLVKRHLDAMNYKYNVSFDYDNQKVVFDMLTEDGEHIYIKIVGSDEYTLLIERYSKIGHRTVMKSIGEKYCSTHGYFDIGRYGTATADEIKEAVKSNLDSHEKWCSKIQKQTI